MYMHVDLPLIRFGLTDQESSCSGILVKAFHSQVSLHSVLKDEDEIKTCRLMNTERAYQNHLNSTHFSSPVSTDVICAC